MSHPRNLCATVENRPQYQTQKCAVKHRKAFPPAFALDPRDPDYLREDAIYTWDHQWSDHAGGLKGGKCAKCGKTLKEVRVRINPKTGKPVSTGRIAREIALAVRDVPPIHFIGRLLDGRTHDEFPKA